MRAEGSLRVRENVGSDLPRSVNVSRLIVKLVQGRKALNLEDASAYPKAVVGQVITPEKAHRLRDYFDLRRSRSTVDAFVNTPVTIAVWRRDSLGGDLYRRMNVTRSLSAFFQARNNCVTRVPSRS